MHDFVKRLSGIFGSSTTEEDHQAKESPTSAGSGSTKQVDGSPCCSSPDSVTRKYREEEDGATSDAGTESTSAQTTRGFSSQESGTESWSQGDASWNSSTLTEAGDADGIGKSRSLQVARHKAGHVPSAIQEEGNEDDEMALEIEKELKGVLAQSQKEAKEATDKAAAAKLRGGRLEPPPGLDAKKGAHIPQMSVGSANHSTGECSPCIWYWKAQGCQRGHECGFCHLCPEGEVKARKKAKLRFGATGAGTQQQSQNQNLVEDDDDDDEGEQISNLMNRSPEMSEGAKLHAKGECRPCAWFWKPQGCLNGAECRHCHLCDEGEIKNRKKAKVNTIRSVKDSSTDNEDEASPKDSAANLKPPPGLPEPLGQPSVGSALHGTGMCRPCAWLWKPQGCTNGAECRHCHLCPEGEIKARRKLKLEGSRKGDVEGSEELDEEELAQVKVTEDSSPRKLLLAEALGGSSMGDANSKAFVPGGYTFPSPGSALHGSGICRPCAWYWKPQGCSNGAECRHCHLCPQGEIKVRRKVKATLFRDAGGEGMEVALPGAIPGLPLDAMANPFGPTTYDHCLEAMDLDTETDYLRHEFESDMPAWVTSSFHDLALSPMSITSPLSNFGSMPATIPGMSSPVAASSASAGDPSSPVRIPIELSSSLPLPSVGSELHSLGKCRPCAWFWKPQGCTNGAECAHCHVCPEGELKNRKRAKETAMRIGAIDPQPKGTDPKTPRVVKIAPSLGA